MQGGRGEHHTVMRSSASQGTPSAASSSLSFHLDPRRYVLNAELGLMIEDGAACHLCGVVQSMLERLIAGALRYCGKPHLMADHCSAASSVQLVQDVHPRHLQHFIRADEEMWKFFNSTLRFQVILSVFLDHATEVLFRRLGVPIYTQGALPSCKYYDHTAVDNLQAKPSTLVTSQKVINHKKNSNGTHLLPEIFSMTTPCQMARVAAGIDPLCGVSPKACVMMEALIRETLVALCHAIICSRPDARVITSVDLDGAIRDVLPLRVAVGATSSEKGVWSSSRGEATVPPKGDQVGYVRLCVRGVQGTRAALRKTFKVSSGSLLSIVFTRFCERLHIEQADVVFVHDGTVLSGCRQLVESRGIAIAAEKPGQQLHPPAGSVPAAASGRERNHDPLFSMSSEPKRKFRSTRKGLKSLSGDGMRNILKLAPPRRSRRWIATLADETRGGLGRLENSQIPLNQQLTENMQTAPSEDVPTGTFTDSNRKGGERCELREGDGATLASPTRIERTVRRLVSMESCLRHLKDSMLELQSGDQSDLSSKISTFAVNAITSQLEVTCNLSTLCRHTITGGDDVGSRRRVIASSHGDQSANPSGQAKADPRGTRQPSDRNCISDYDKLDGNRNRMEIQPQLRHDNKHLSSATNDPAWRADFAVDVEAVPHSSDEPEDQDQVQRECTDETHSRVVGEECFELHAQDGSDLAPRQPVDGIPAECLPSGLGYDCERDARYNPARDVNQEKCGAEQDGAGGDCAQFSTSCSLAYVEEPSKEKGADLDMLAHDSFTKDPSEEERTRTAGESMFSCDSVGPPEHHDCMGDHADVTAEASSSWSAFVDLVQDPTLQAVGSPLESDGDDHYPKGLENKTRVVMGADAAPSSAARCEADRHPKCNLVGDSGLSTGIVGAKYLDVTSGSVFSRQVYEEAQVGIGRGCSMKESNKVTRGKVRVARSMCEEGQNRGDMNAGLLKLNSEPEEDLYACKRKMSLHANDGGVIDESARSVQPIMVSGQHELESPREPCEEDDGAGSDTSKTAIVSRGGNDGNGDVASIGHDSNLSTSVAGISQCLSGFRASEANLVSKFPSMILEETFSDIGTDDDERPPEPGDLPCDNDNVEGLEYSGDGTRRTGNISFRDSSARLTPSVKVERADVEDEGVKQETIAPPAVIPSQRMGLVDSVANEAQANPGTEAAGGMDTCEQNGQLWDDTLDEEGGDDGGKWSSWLDTCGGG